MGDRKYNTIFHENSKNLKEIIKAEFGETEGVVDAIVTSPPYANLQDYGDQDDQIGEQDYEIFLRDLKDIFKQCYEIAADDATLWVITDTFKRNNRLVRLPFDIADEVENLQGKEWCDECDSPLERNRDNGQLICKNSGCGKKHYPLNNSWRMEDHIIWNKKRTRPWRRKGQLRNTYEHISMFSKSDVFEYNIDNIRISDTSEFSRWWVDYPERYNPKGKVPANVWDFPIPKQGEWGPKLNFHPSPFPAELIKRIINLATEEGDVILDPFAGVGTTLAVAESLNRKSIGFELNEEFIEHYGEHIRPNIVSEQTKLVEENQREETAKKIWTLRIHKYAREFYKCVRNIEGITLYEDEIEGVISVTDSQMLTSDSNRIDVDLVYLTENGVTITEEEVQQVRDGLKSDDSGSGDYYELDTDIKVESITSLNNSIFDDQQELYIYVGGNHHYYKDVVEYESSTDTIQRVIKNPEYQTAIPPIISNLKIRVENPYSGARGEYETSERRHSREKSPTRNLKQSNLEQYSENDGQLED